MSNPIMDIPKSGILTKVLANQETGEFITILRGTNMPHGPFFTTTKNGHQQWGHYRFGKLHGYIFTAMKSLRAIYKQYYTKGKRDPFTVITRDENNHGIPFNYNEMLQENESKVFTDMRTFSISKSKNTIIQKILVKKVNKTENGRATKDTIEEIYEPTIGGPLFPAVVNTYKDIEIGKIYTRWFRPGFDGTYKMIAMGRSNAVANDNVELGFNTNFEEIVILSEPVNETFNILEDGSLEVFFELFNVTDYERLKEKDNKEGLFVEFNGQDVIAKMSVGTPEGDTKEIEANLGGTDVDLLLFDLQRGSGTGIAKIRASVLAQFENAGEGKVSSSNAEDVQLSGEETSSIPSGNEDGVGNTGSDKSESVK